jgi:peptidoglycan/LPS O-acetylase OafA/YrhL
LRVRRRSRRRKRGWGGCFVANDARLARGGPGALRFAGLKTLDRAFADNDGAAPGADVLRLLLATGVLVYHAIPTTGGADAIQGHRAAPLAELMVPMFFTLSGLLVSASALRTTVRQFAVNRALRIYPGLVVVTMLTALVLGPAVTTEPLGVYFRDALFWRYLANGVAWVSYRLPGVFATNPFPNAVNGSLWSIPIELECYAALTVLMACGVIRRRYVLFALAAAVLTLNAIVSTGSAAIPLVSPLSLRLFAFFAAGGLAYVYREKVPLHAGVFALALLGSAILIPTNPRSSVLPIVLGYCTVYLAMTRLPWPSRFRGTDYSYGVYIYAFPIQQTVALFMPRPMDWKLNLAVALPITLACAAASWHLIERPALALKRRGWSGPRIRRAA